MVTQLRLKAGSSISKNKEILAIMHTLAKWRQYLLGSKFLIQTDHSSLQYLLQQKILSTEQQKWIEKITIFDMDILHNKGKDSVLVDALLRKDKELSLLVVSVVVPEWLNEIRSEYAKDPETSAIINNLPQNSKFEWKNDILWYMGRIYLNGDSKFKSKVLKESHDSLSARHVGYFKTYYNARQPFFWKGMSNDIQKYVAECDKC